MIVLVALLLVGIPGDTALEAFNQGLALEMAQAACNDGEQSACQAAAENPEHLQALMIQIVHQGQQVCADNPESSACDALRQLDETAAAVMAKHPDRRT